MTLGSLTTALESADSRLNLKHKRPRRIAVRDVSSFLACTYPHKELCPLFIALIDDEHALTYDVLLRLNKLRKKKKEEGRRRSPWQSTGAIDSKLRDCA